LFLFSRLSSLLVAISLVAASSPPPSPRRCRCIISSRPRASFSKAPPASFLQGAARFVSFTCLPCSLHHRPLANA
jgi:hypothetical protein